MPRTRHQLRKTSCFLMKKRQKSAPYAPQILPQKDIPHRIKTIKEKPFVTAPPSTSPIRSLLGSWVRGWLLRCEDFVEFFDAHGVASRVWYLLSERTISTIWWTVSSIDTDLIPSVSRRNVMVMHDPLSAWCSVCDIASVPVNLKIWSKGLSHWHFLEHAVSSSYHYEYLS